MDIQFNMCDYEHTLLGLTHDIVTDEFENELILVEVGFIFFTITFIAKL